MFAAPRLPITGPAKANSAGSSRTIRGWCQSRSCLGRGSTTSTGFSKKRSVKVDPGRRVVAGLLFAPRPFVDAGAAQAVGGLGRAQEMVEPEAGVALPAAGG